VVEGGEMNEQLKEKIARIIYTVRLNIMHGFYVNDMEIAQQILDLPMPDLNCTVGEALENERRLIMGVEDALYILEYSIPKVKPQIRKALISILINALTLKDGRRICPIKMAIRQKRN